MKDAMTDHKAHVRVLKGFAATYTGETGEAFRAAIAALAAAPEPFLSGGGCAVSNVSEATINSDGIDSKLIDAASEGEDGAVALLEALLAHIDAETCTHEETHRGGAIWTICDGCGRQWADDRGGFKPHAGADEYQQQGGQPGGAAQGQR